MEAVHVADLGFDLRSIWPTRSPPTASGSTERDGAGNDMGKRGSLSTSVSPAGSSAGLMSLCAISGRHSPSRERPATPGRKATRRQTSAIPTKRRSVSRTQRTIIRALFGHRTGNRAADRPRSWSGHHFAASCASMTAASPGFDDALHCWRRALKYRRGERRPVGEGFGHHSLGDIFRDVGQFSDVIDHLGRDWLFREGDR